MHRKLIEFNLKQRNKKLPDLQAGDVVKIYRKIKEGEKERTQAFEGIIIAIKGKQSSSPMVIVRKISFGVGVELVLPIYSPQIDKIELVKRAKVRRSKLYYIRGKSAKSIRMKYKDLSEFAKEEEAPEEKPEDMKVGNQGEIKKESKPEAEVKEGIKTKDKKVEKIKSEQKKEKK